MHSISKRWLAPLMGLLILPAGCDEFLEESPRGVLTPTNFYQNGGDAIAAVNAAYQQLHSNYINDMDYMVLVEYPTPQMQSRQAPGDHSIGGCLDVYRCSSNDSPTGDMWQAIYRAINSANAVVDNVPNIQKMDPGLRARVVAEAKFLRAFHYFNMVRLWGGVPLRKNETNGLTDLEIPRAPANEVYDFIIQDLTEAQKDLPVSYPASDYGRATRGAAQTLLGKVYLQRGIAGKSNPFGDPLYWPSAQPGDLDKAIAELREVVQSNQYRLVANYGELWREETERNSEVIFALQNIMQRGLGSDAAAWFGPVGSWGPSHWILGSGELPFYQSYSPGDKRRPVTWLTEFVDKNGVTRKFEEDNIKGDNWTGHETPAPDKYLPKRFDIGQGHSEPTDWPILRYADVLLMLAEALDEKSPGSAEALALVNQVRARAGMTPLARLTKEALYWERNWELATEQHARYDAQRFWDLYAAHVHRNSLLGKTSPQKYPRGTVPQIEVVLAEPKDRLSPIPLRAMDRNPQLVQNPGY